MNHQPYIFRETEYDAEIERLLILEDVFDSQTRRSLLNTNLAPGWKCLEVGPGAGSIATWLSDTVGAAGGVLAVDVNARFLSRLSRPNIALREANIATVSIEPASMDLAHVRFVLIHAPQWMDAWANIVASLKPGGWVVIEEPDFSCSRALAGPQDFRHAFESVHRSIEVMFQQRGLDYAFGARLPEVFEKQGLESISIENECSIVPGMHPHARMMAMSTSHLAETYIATGAATREDIRLYRRFANDPTCWATYHATIRAAGRKPGTPQVHE